MVTGCLVKVYICLPNVLYIWSLSGKTVHPAQDKTIRFSICSIAVHIPTVTHIQFQYVIYIYLSTISYIYHTSIIHLSSTPNTFSLKNSGTKHAGFPKPYFRLFWGWGNFPVSISLTYHTAYLGDYVWYLGTWHVSIQPVPVGSFDCGWTTVTSSWWDRHLDWKMMGLHKVFAWQVPAKVFFVGAKTFQNGEPRRLKGSHYNGYIETRISWKSFQEKLPQNVTLHYKHFFTLKLSKLYEVLIFFSPLRKVPAPKKHRVNWKTVLNKFSLKWRGFDWNQPPEWGLFSMICV